MDVMVFCSADIGGLGQREGAPVAHVWRPPPPPSPWVVETAGKAKGGLLSTLVLLPLFLFRANRCKEAWLIWLPLGVTVFLAAGIVSVCMGDDSEAMNTFSALAIGMAGLWLVMPYLESQSRLRLFFKAAPVVASISLLAFSPVFLGRSTGFLDFRAVFAVALGVASLAVALALVLSGWTVRRRFGHARFLFWTMVWLFAVLNLPTASCGLLSSGRIDWEDYVRSLLLASISIFGLLTPLLLLSFFQPFYRDRFFAFLKISPEPRALGAEAAPEAP